MYVEGVGNAAEALCRSVFGYAVCCGAVETHGVEVDNIPTLALGDNPLLGVWPVLYLDERVEALHRWQISSAVVYCCKQYAVAGHWIERAVARSRYAILLARSQVDAVQLIAARGYRTEIEAAIGSSKVAEGGIRTLRNALHTNAVDARDVHTVVIRNEDVECLGLIVPRHTVYLAAILECSLARQWRCAVYHHRVAAIDAILHPRDAVTRSRCGVEHVVGTTQRARMLLIEIHIVKL